MSIPFRLSPIFCLVLASFVQAEEPTVTPAPTDRSASEAAPAALDQAVIEPAPTPADQTVIEADHIQGDSDRQVQAQGNVTIEQPGRTVSAERVEYYRDPERVVAQGRVRYQQAGLWLTADSLDYAPAAQTGRAKNIAYRVEARGRLGFGSAERVDFLGPNRYGLAQGRFSTCEPDRQDWYIQAGRIDLDYGRSIGVVNNATLHFKGVPIGWAPWLDFPLGGQRKSGLLAPRIGSVSGGGFDLTLPYYWNIAPNYDFTLSPRFMAQRGVQIGGEFRYLRPSFTGELRGDFLPDDQKYDPNRNASSQTSGGATRENHRYGVRLSHRQRLASSLTGHVNYQKVSDDAYFADLGDRLEAATQVTLPQEAWIDFTSTTHWKALLRVQRYQTLQDPDYLTRRNEILQTTTPGDARDQNLQDYARRVLTSPPYWRLPQLSVQGVKPLDWGPTLQIDSEWVSFARDEDQQWVLRDQGLNEQINGQRFHFYPALSWPFKTPYAYVTPRAGWMFTQYQLDRGEKDSISRSLPTFSLDSGMTFERGFAFDNQDYVQTLEPRFYYVYIPYKNQSDIPDFDTAELTFNFAQMFLENRFSGVDKINEANQLTFALTTRFLDNENGRERMRFALGQRFYFSDQRVTLQDNRNQQTSDGSRASRSDILLSAGGTVNESLRLDSYAQYDPSEGSVERFAVTANYRPEAGKVLNLGYRFNRHPQLTGIIGTDERIDQADVSVQWPIYKRWYAMGRTLYSLQDNDLLEGVAGFEYNAGCWILRAVGQRYVVSSDRKANSWFLQLELNGLGGIGSNPLGVLRDSIFGYRKTNELSGGDAPVSGQ